MPRAEHKINMKKYKNRNYTRTEIIKTEIIKTEITEINGIAWEDRIYSVTLILFFVKCFL